MRTTTTEGRSENLGRASCELCDVAVFGDAYNNSDTKFDNEQVIFSHPLNTFTLFYHVEHANTICI